MTVERRFEASTRWRHSALLSTLAVLVCPWFLAACDGVTSDDAESASRVRSTEQQRGEAQPRERRGESTRHGGSRAQPKTRLGHKPERRSLRRGPKPPEFPRTYVVTRVVDGDTLELGNGETIRLVGVDTPEAGECGFDRAAATLERLVLWKRVRLTASAVEDRDRYGRLLRYVDVGSQDAGLRLIKNGLAIARYDSRDGYGYHPREPRYIAADRASPNVGCSTEPAPAPAPRGFVGGGMCAAGYKPCIPPYPPDLDCADVNGPVYVTGSDLHDLDAEGDGVGCE